VNKDIILKWLENSEKNVAVASDMYRLGHYNWCLFMWHLAIEKILKAYLAKQDKEIPYIHDLGKLSDLAGIDFGKIGITKDELSEITGYNLEARYEDYKYDFYKKTTKEYTDIWIPRCESVYKFVKESINA